MAAVVGVFVAGTDVLAGVDVVGVLVVAAVWTLADAGIVMPSTLSIFVLAAEEPAGSSVASAHTSAKASASRACGPIPRLSIIASPC